MESTNRPRIVVGTDGSSGSRRALRWALAEAELRGAELDVVHAIQLYAVSLGVPTYPTAHMHYPYDVEEAGRHLLDQELAELPVGRGEVAVHGELVEGRPAAALIERSLGAELLVVGSRGLGGFSGLLLGSVAQQCAQHAHCPVVVVGPAVELPQLAQEAAIGVGAAI